MPHCCLRLTQTFCRGVLELALPEEQLSCSPSARLSSVIVSFIVRRVHFMLERVHLTANRAIASVRAFRFDHFRSVRCFSVVGTALHLSSWAASRRLERASNTCPLLSFPVLSYDCMTHTSRERRRVNYGERCQMRAKTVMFTFGVTLDRKSVV